MTNSFLYFNNIRVHEVKKISPRDENKIKNIEKYIREKYKDKIKEYLRKIGKDKFEVDYEQPIIEAENNYDYLPQLCYKVFSFSDIKETDISKKIIEKIRISNKERLEKIKDAIKDISFIEKEALKVSYKKLKLPYLIVKDKEGVDKKIIATDKIFKENYYPYENPLKNKKIKTYIIINNDITLKSKGKELLNELKEKLEISFELKGEFIFEDKILDKIPKEDDFGLVVIFGTGNYKELKVGLLDKNYISQFIDIKTIRSKSWKYAKNNIIFQIAQKIGIRYFALESKIPYDYIVGFDVSRKKNVNIGGCAIIYDSSGIFKNIYPIEIPQGGETTEINFILEKLKNKGYIELNNRKFLILRDGKIPNNELNGLERISKDYNCEFLIIGIIKDHIYFIDNLYNLYGIYLNFANLTFLLPHKIKKFNNEKPLKIEHVYLIKYGQMEKFKLNEEIIQILYNLSRLNYSSINYEHMSIKCPAPIHYVDKFLNFTHLTGGEKYEKFLERGFLYFI